jgi:hypothetical protein
MQAMLQEGGYHFRRKVSLRETRGETPAQFSAAWKTQWHNASLIKFANLQNAIFRRELDR